MAALHATLASRSSLHDRLLALNGRLDLVLSQVELKSSQTPAQERVYKKGKHRKHLTRYVEGASSSDENIGPAEKRIADVEVLSEGEEGSVEDIELGDGSDYESGSEDDLDENEDDDEDDSEGEEGVKGFIDDEAEENWDEDESDDSEE